MSQPLLSILIPTTPDREDFFKNIFKQVHDQCHGFCENEYLPYGSDTSIQFYRHSNAFYELLTFCDNKKYSIGFKRNELMRISKGKYVAFIDDDDRISDNYFNFIIPGMESGADCCSLKGIITEDGQNPLVFEHSIKYKEYKTNHEGMPVRYERFPNHLNCIKSSIAKQFKFPEKNHGEDTDWATQIFKSGLIKTEHYIEEILYYYDWRKK